MISCMTRVVEEAIFDIRYFKLLYFVRYLCKITDTRLPMKSQTDWDVMRFSWEIFMLDVCACVRDAKVLKCNLEKTTSFNSTVHAAFKYTFLSNKGSSGGVSRAE